ncbi:MAG: tRNA (adenosine(37)-N6)-threonylcarbamoyltransferase complex ATPase subunit type 1 TsaE [Prevotellaceae bacterium]|jgi:tRNA threonylcarbamoyladenosine biosynthesis protein TsaE|nr:tRNA (adenosine(37)-N6)-threonylcarbamoyltransferase complex ATPase subunit type 1 TsaE [Prevotellaceae bacterium]
MAEIDIPSLEALPQVAKQFVLHIKENLVFAFRGEVGAGKTTFIRTICDELGVIDAVTSPTFAIINEYQTGSGKTIYHFDCYRISSVREATQIDLEDYFYSGNLCFVEWAENIEQILPKNTVNVQINVLDDNTRKIVILES